MLECSLWKNLLDLWSETRLGQRDVVVYLLLLLWLVPCGLQRGEKRDSRWERSFPAHTAKLGEPWSLLAGVGPSTDNTFLLLSSVVAQQEKILPPRPSLLEAGSDGSEEPKQQVSWEQEFLVGNSPGGSGRALCMVCGAEIQAPSADTARAHILEQHPHTLDLSPSEKSNILEAWSEGAALVQDFRAEQPSPHHSGSRGRSWGRGESQNLWLITGICPLQTQARTPTWTLPGCQQRLSFSSTPRTTHPSPGGPGPGDFALWNFLVSYPEASEAELG